MSRINEYNPEFGVVFDEYSDWMDKNYPGHKDAATGGSTTTTKAAAKPVAPAIPANLAAAGFKQVPNVDWAYAPPAAGSKNPSGRVAYLNASTGQWATRNANADDLAVLKASAGSPAAATPAASGTITPPAAGTAAATTPPVTGTPPSPAQQSNEATRTTVTSDKYGTPQLVTEPNNYVAGPSGFSRTSLPGNPNPQDIGVAHQVSFQDFDPKNPTGAAPATTGGAATGNRIETGAAQNPPNASPIARAIGGNDNKPIYPGGPSPEGAAAMGSIDLTPMHGTWLADGTAWFPMRGGSTVPPEIVHLVVNEWGDKPQEIPTALAIASRESGGVAKAEAVNGPATGAPGTRDTGIFAINERNWPSLGLTAESAKDAATNVVAARTLYDRSQGWSPWGGADPYQPKGYGVGNLMSGTPPKDATGPVLNSVAQGFSNAPVANPTGVPPTVIPVHPIAPQPGSGSGGGGGGGGSWGTAPTPPQVGSHNEIITNPLNPLEPTSVTVNGHSPPPQPAVMTNPLDQLHPVQTNPGVIYNPLDPLSPIKTAPSPADVTPQPSTLNPQGPFERTVSGVNMARPVEPVPSTLNPQPGFFDTLRAENGSKPAQPSFLDQAKANAAPTTPDAPWLDKFKDFATSAKSAMDAKAGMAIGVNTGLPPASNPNTGGGTTKPPEIIGQPAASSVDTTPSVNAATVPPPTSTNLYGQGQIWHMGNMSEGFNPIPFLKQMGVSSTGDADQDAVIAAKYLQSLPPGGSYADPLASKPIGSSGFFQSPKSGQLENEIRTDAGYVFSPGKINDSLSLRSPMNSGAVTPITTPNGVVIQGANGQQSPAAQAQAYQQAGFGTPVLDPLGNRQNNPDGSLQTYPLAPTSNVGAVIAASQAQVQNGGQPVDYVSSANLPSTAQLQSLGTANAQTQEAIDKAAADAWAAANGVGGGDAGGGDRVQYAATGGAYVSSHPQAIVDLVTGKPIMISSEFGQPEKTTITPMQTTSTTMPINEVRMPGSAHTMGGIVHDPMTANESRPGQGTTFAANGGSTIYTGGGLQPDPNGPRMDGGKVGSGGDTPTDDGHFKPPLYDPNDPNIPDGYKIPIDNGTGNGTKGNPGDPGQPGGPKGPPPPPTPPTPPVPTGGGNGGGPLSDTELLSYQTGLANEQRGRDMYGYYNQIAGVPTNTLVSTDDGTGGGNPFIPGVGYAHTDYSSAYKDVQSRIGALGPVRAPTDVYNDIGATQSQLTLATEQLKAVIAGGGTPGSSEQADNLRAAIASYQAQLSQHQDELQKSLQASDLAKSQDYLAGKIRTGATPKATGGSAITDPLRAV